MIKISKLLQDRKNQNSKRNKIDLKYINQIKQTAIIKLFSEKADNYIKFITQLNYLNN